MWGGQLLLLAAGLVVRAHGQAQVLRLSGACNFMNILNGLEFEKQGTTASGAPWYKARTQNLYIYHDLACAASHDGTPRWIIDSDQPSTTVTKDLDGDSDCAYYAAADSSSTLQPPLAAPWTMFCDGHWQPQQLSLEEIQSDAATTGPMTTTVAVTTPRPAAYMLEVDGVCHYINYLNGMIFEIRGRTASGAPYYKSTTAAYYIYYDPDCSGVTQGFSRWIIDDNEPSLTKTEDLDNDGDCVYQARVDVTSQQTSEPPRSANWMMQCGAGTFEEHHLSLVEITTTSTSTMTTATSSTKTSTITSTTATTSSITRTSTGTSITTTKTPTTVTATTAAPTTSATATTTAAVLVATTEPPVPASTTPATCAGFACPATMVAKPNATVPVGEQASNASCCMVAPTSLPITTTMDNVQATTGANQTTTLPGVADTTTPVVELPTTTPIATPPAQLELSGACSEKASLNGMIFEMQGVTKSGAPYYKAAGVSQYLYYDLDCNGAGKSPRWIIDSNAPSSNSSSDLDGDGRCHYIARMITSSSAAVPNSGTWRMPCANNSWVDVDLTLAEVSAPVSTTAHAEHGGHGGHGGHEGGHGQHSVTTTVPMQASPGNSSLVLQGGCSQMSVLNGLTFQQEGTTASGAPWYKATNKAFYIYYDPDCDAAGPATARWIIDDSRPSNSSANDLDADGDCNYLARVDSTDLARPPLSANWTMNCGGRFQAEPLTLMEEYVKISSGSCADIGMVPVSDAGTCATAAASMGLSATSTVMTISSLRRPEGCSWDPSAKELQLAPSPGNRGNGASMGLEPLCTVSVGGGSHDQAALSAAAGTGSCSVLAAVVALAMFATHH